MKKAVIIGIIILLFTVPFVYSQTDASRWDLLANALKRLQERMNILESTVAAQADVQHRVFRDLGEECTFIEDIGEVGWCPDDIQTLFVIPDANYQLGSTVVVNVATQFVSTGQKIIKRSSCDMNAVVYDSAGIPYLHISCPPDTVIEGTLLDYTIVN